MVHELTAATARWLTGDEGLAAVAATTAELDAGDEELTVASRIRRAGLDAARATAVVGAATARRRARARWPDADRLLFTPVALEQASDPEVSAWRARRLEDADVWDLCAGIGGDALALAAEGASVDAVDLDAARLELLVHNARVRGLEVRPHVGDALAVTLPADAAMHADPGRRREGRRVRRLADHLPGVGVLLGAHEAAPTRAVVLSPAVDLDDPDLPADAELEFVQVGDDLREAVVWLGAARRGSASATATLLPSEESRSRGARGPRLAVGGVGEVLLQVAPAAVRARLHDEIGEEVGARRLATGRALLTCEADPGDSAWYRRRHVHAVLPARPRSVRGWLRSADERPVEIAVHGLGADPVAWWREIGRPPRGPDGWRLELVRTDDGAIAIVTADLPASSPADAERQAGRPPEGP
jgi:hypothetical protein